MTLAFPKQPDGSVDMTVRAWIVDGVAASNAGLPRRDFTFSVCLDGPPST